MFSIIFDTNFTSFSLHSHPISTRLYLFQNAVWQWGLTPHKVTCLSPSVPSGYEAPGPSLWVPYCYLTLNVPQSDDILCP